MSGYDETKYVKLMQPILTREERAELRKAGVVIFDPKMSKGNMYILHISRLLELVRGSKERVKGR